MALQLNSAEWNCPCRNIDTIRQLVTKSHIVNFYVLQHHGKELQIKSIKHFCTILNDSAPFQGFYNSCRDMLNRGFESSGWNISLANTVHMNSMTTTNLNPVAFMYDVCMTWEGGISQASSSFLISNFRMSQKEAQQLENFVNLIQTALRTCASHTSWPPPNKKLYALKAKAFGGERLKMQLNIAIDFNWTEYIAMCGPSYCDHLKTNSKAWNLFTALAQMGGFISAAVLVVRTLLWPAICLAVGWQTNFTTASTRISVDEEWAMPTTPYGRLKRWKSVRF